MIYLPSPQFTGSFTCLLDEQTRNDMFPIFIKKIWNAFLTWLHVVPSKKELIDREIKEIQTDLDRSFHLVFNKVKYTNAEAFANDALSQGIPEESVHHMLMLSYQKGWAIFMHSLKESKINTYQYHPFSPLGFQSAEWETVDGRVKFIAKHTFSLLPIGKDLEYHNMEKKIVSFTYEYTLGKKHLHCTYQPSEWKKSLLNAAQNLMRLESPVSLFDLMMTMHEANIALNRDVRKEVLELYNQGKSPEEQLPTTWNESLLSHIYEADTPALQEALRQVTTLF
jgi:hypothetical protein